MSPFIVAFCHTGFSDILFDLCRVSGENITKENLAEFIEQYDEERLERKELQDEDEEGAEGAQESE
jgi:hypothetical protein